MKTEGWPRAAILRNCRSCARWLSIEAFDGLGKVCQTCIRGEIATGRIALSRAIVITPQGRAAIREGSSTAA